MLLLYIFLVLNLFAFALMGYDKKQAKNKKTRISEKTLLTFVFFGGTIGSGFGMLIFRHKTAKRSYLVKFWLIVIVQILMVCFYFN